MSRLNKEAESTWSEYLQQVRIALSSMSQAEVNDVVMELEAHLENELTEQTDCDVVALIARLGSPESIAEAYDIDATRTAAPTTLDTSLLLASLLLVVVSPWLALGMIASLPAAALLARIALNHPGVFRSPLRWAGYPALLISYAAIALLLLFWPLLPVLPLAATGGFLSELLSDRGAASNPGSPDYWIQVWSVAIIVCGVWWCLCAKIVDRYKPTLTRLFFPFLQASQLEVNKTFVVGGLLQITAATLAIIFLA